MFWKVEEIVKVVEKPGLNSWFFVSSKGFYIKKVDIKYKYIIFRDNSRWKKILLETQNFHEKNGKCTWIRYVNTISLITTFETNELCNVGSFNPEKLIINTTKNPSKIKEFLNEEDNLNGWYSWDYINCFDELLTYYFFMEDDNIEICVQFKNNEYNLLTNKNLETFQITTKDLKICPKDITTLLNRYYL
jgi:hypothetical protein